MGWGRMLLLGNVGQQLDIHDSQQALAQIAAELREHRRAGRQVAHTVDQLAAENAELKLYLAAVIRLLVHKGALSPAELQQLVAELDRSDGAADGRFAGPVNP